jgi:D-sedoheptulose 7-phosphate isomerase
MSAPKKEQPPDTTDLCRRYPVLGPLQGDLQRAHELLRRCVAGDHKILVCGNGGSAADAEHIVGELMKSCAWKRPISAADRVGLLAMSPDSGPLADALEVGIPAVSLVGQIGLTTAYANDRDYAYGFAQQVYGLGRPGDALIAISTSGNSRNIVHACRVARLRGVAIIGLTGQSGGRMADLCDVAIRAPETQTHLVQELHLPIYHWLCLALEEHLFGEHGKRS